MDSMTIERQLFVAARAGDLGALTALLDANPDAMQAREKPYAWTLLHAAAHTGHLSIVNLLLARGLDPNAREQGDNTYPMHWAAAAGHLDVVRRLADAGGDVIGLGDDHALTIIGWATCWDDSDDAAHRAVAAFLVSRGAPHHIFSAVALSLEDEVRRIVAAHPPTVHARMSRNENNQTALQFAVRKKRSAMVALLLELGADPLATDAVGVPVTGYARGTGSDLRVMEVIRTMTLAEITSADRGHRPSRGGALDLVACIALADWDTAERLLRDNSAMLHDQTMTLLAGRGDPHGVQWMLDHGADPNMRWGKAGHEVTAAHVAAWNGHADVLRLLLDAGADPSIRDGEHDSDVRGWAEYAGRSEIVRLLDER